MQTIVPDIFPRETVTAVFTTRAVAGDIPAISAITTFPPHCIYLPLQRHTDTIAVIAHDLRPQIADAVISARKGLLLGIQVADCVPLLMYDKKRAVVAAVHAGWRGTAAGIVKKTIARMGDLFSSSPADILVAFGASIRECCYPVGRDVVEAVEKTTGRGPYLSEDGDVYRLDLATANRLQALSCGIRPEHVWTSGECTCCLPGRYHSYRRERNFAGRQHGFIGMR